MWFYHDSSVAVKRVRLKLRDERKDPLLVVDSFVTRRTRFSHYPLLC